MQWCEVGARTGRKTRIEFVLEINPTGVLSPGQFSVSEVQRCVSELLVTLTRKKLLGKK